MKGRRFLLLVGFAVLFSVGVTILAIAEIMHADDEVAREKNPKWKPSRLHVVGVPFLQHFASALIVAAVMGVTYEYFVHKHVIEDFDKLLLKHDRATENTLYALLATTARDVFLMIADIAKQNERIPTLFKPPRKETSEYVFAADIDFFERLIGGAKAREDAIEVLRTWLESDTVQLRFLGSDFVGRLKLHELAPLLRDIATRQQQNWTDLDDQERGVVLNYWWAVSACEEPPYQLLRTQLIDWDDPFVQQWLLFVPQQMPDDRLAQIVKLFLRIRGPKAEPEVIRTAIAAIDRLHHRGFNMRRAVTRYRSVFEAAGLWQEAGKAISAAPAVPRPSWAARLRKLTKL